MAARIYYPGRYLIWNERNFIMKEIRIPVRKLAAVLVMAAGILLIYYGFNMNRLNKTPLVETNVIYRNSENNEDKTPTTKNSEYNISENENVDVGVININTATIAELTRLSGIGEVKAQAIVDYREQNGQFKSVDELINVPGIGEKTLEKIRVQCTV